MGNERILDRLFSTFQGIFQEVLLVTNDPLQYLSWDLLIVSDLFKAADPDPLSFFNINTPDDLAIAEKILAQRIIR
ncbi:MAG: hypothetical protein JW883_06805 [Deltaproteobacteria bacterium]|nr:hypothetical protein [Deltaproteobacteria bacterium]